MLEIPIVVIRDAIGGEPFLRRGSNAILSIMMPNAPVTNILKRIPGTMPNFMLTMNTIAISAPNA